MVNQLIVLLAPSQPFHSSGQTPLSFDQLLNLRNALDYDTQMEGSNIILDFTTKSGSVASKTRDTNLIPLA